MSKHNDDDMVIVGYSSSRNASFEDQGDELGITWGEWRQMDIDERNAALQDYVNELVDVYVVDGE